MFDKKGSNNETEIQTSPVPTEESSSNESSPASPLSPIDLGNLEINDAEELNNNVSSENVSPVLNSEEQDGNDNKILIDNGNEVENNIKSEKSPSPEPHEVDKVVLTDVTDNLEEVIPEKENSLEEVDFNIENLEDEESIF